MSTFELYDTLIAGIPPALSVRRFGCGAIWSYVESSEGGVGLAMTINATSFPPRRWDYDGMPLRELAELSKSWNFVEAALGVAAINAYYNALPRVRALGARFPTPGTDEQDAFFSMAGEIAGKRIATIGSFPKLSRAFSGAFDLSVIEKDPAPGEYPDSAAEFLLPQQDLIFITGSSLVNKTLPRLLELSRGAQVILLGPTVPLTPLFFDRGVDCLAGYVATDAERCRKIAACGNAISLRKAGERVRLLPEG